MTDWTKSMKQTFEYYIVDPITWKDVKIVNSIKKSSIERDLETDTLGSASFDVAQMMDECYLRVYLVVTQDGVTEKHPLGTFIVQTPSLNYNGRIETMSMDGYTPLIELKENPPPLGYSLLKGSNIMHYAYLIAKDNIRAPVISASNMETLSFDFVANSDDTWMSFLSDMVSNAKYTIGLDEMSRVVFTPRQNLEAMQPVWTYTDDNTSILYPEISTDTDMFGIPNVVEVIYSTGTETYSSRIVNDDSNSPTSIQNRGREIVYRVTNPDITGIASQSQIREYAINLLKELSTLENTITYSHGYCPVRLGDCVRLNYRRAGIIGVKAQVIKQSITCQSGCKVTETAKYVTKLWR